MLWILLSKKYQFLIVEVGLILARRANYMDCYKVVLFDEPFVGLDPHAIKELKALLNEMKKSGTTIIISTHMLDSVEEFWDRVFIMMNGRIEAERERKAVERSGENLEELFFSITEKERVTEDD